MTDLHGNEPVVFDYDAAGQLVTAARGAAAAIRNEKGARSRAVTVAMEQFQGYYSQLFATNARTAAGDGDQLIAALDGLATITQNLIAAAHSEDSRRATARQWYEHHEHRSTLDKIGDALFGEDSPPEGPKPPPPAALPTIPQPQPRHIGGHGSSGGTSSAVPDHLTSFASTSAAANGRIDPHQSKVASLVHTFNANTRWGQIEAGALLAAFLAWNRANDNDVRWAQTIAAAFTAAGGHGGLVTLSNSGLGAALKAAGVNATRQDLAISMPQTKGFSVTTGYSLDPVNTATGNFIESETDLAFAGGSALALTRMYNSFTVEEGAFGHGWSSLAEAGLAVDDEHASLTLADGRVVVFPRLGDGWGQPVSDALWLTTLEDGSHRITGNDGSWWACSAAGRMTAYGTGPGTTVTLTHDEQGHLVEISHERGRAVTLTWTGERISAAATSDGRTASYSYDDEGHLLSVSAPGADRTYRWDTEAHLITAVLDADGVVEAENTYDDRRRVVTQLTPHGRHVRFSYLPGRVTIIDDPDGSHANTWIADPWGRLVGVIDSDDQRQSMSYDAHGNLVVLTERDGSTTIHEYDDRSRRTRTVLPSGADFRYAYDGAGRVVSVIAGAPESPDALTTYTYDRDERNPSTITDPEGGVTTLTWELGLLKRIVDPTGVVVTYEHDEHGNVVAAIDAEGNTARLERDDVGRVVGAATPLGHRTTYAYDGAGRLARRTDPDGAVWTYAYTAAGRLATIVDPTGAATTMEHDASGEETRTIDPLGRAVDRTFDELGNVSGVTLPDGSHWTFSHDSLSRPTEITTPDGSSWTPGFDRVGTTDSLVDPTGRGVTGSVDIASGTATVSDGMTEVGIRTDSYGRALAHEQADGGETIYTYDRCGRVVEIVDAEGGLTRIRRDASPGLSSLWKQPLDGAVYAEPLVVDGRVIVATENDTLYALDVHNGQVQWHTSVGTPVPLSDLPCGNVDPLGITGTPVYDPQTGLVFSVAEIQGPAHILVGIDLKTGQVKVRRLVDPPGADPQTHQQRAALALYGGRVYIAFGGLYGDCGDYHGLVVASRTDGTGPLLSYQVPTQRLGGIWAPPGPVIDGQGNLYVAVGNGAATQGKWDHSDSILRLSPGLQLEDGFAPQSWQSDNASDSDLGSMSPVLLPNGLMYTDGKSGQGYLLRADHLGGVGGQIQTISLCSAYGGAALSGLSLFIPCSDGLRQLRLEAGAHVVPGWHAPQQVTGSPVIGGQTVYSLDPGSGVLYALDASTGKVRATLSVGTTSRFATPALSQGSIFVGTLTGVVAVGMA